MAETLVAGIPIPSTSPVFLAGIAIHVAFGLAAAVTGLAAMLSPKGRGRHRHVGVAYFWALAGVFATASALAAVRWDEDKALFALAGLAFGAVAIGRVARRRLLPGWARIHIVAMGVSYIALLTAFYVDNGKSLPVWRDLPRLAYWIGPTLVGLPIIVATLARHPLARTAGRWLRR